MSVCVAWPEHVWEGAMGWSEGLHMREFYIDSDGVRLHAKLEMPKGRPGSCPLCIVQHGLTGNMEENHIVGVAAAMREVGVATLRTELYGHGLSGGSFERHTLLKWVDNMLDVIDYAKGLDFASELLMCGHSQGGLLTMLMAALRPDDLSAIIPMSPAIVICDCARTGSMFGLAFDPAHVPDVVALEEGGPDGLVLSGDYFRIAQHIDVDEAIRAWHGPVLITHGTADEAVPVRYSEEAAAAYENARLALLEDDDHGYHRRLDEVCEAIQVFLRDLT